MSEVRASYLEKQQAFVIASLVALAVVLFVVASFVVRWYHHKEQGLAQQWFARGQTTLAAGRADLAVDDFRNALAYHQSPKYWLELAQALIAAGRHPEARDYLLTLWDQQPGNGQVNLELARLAAERKEVSQAQQYYLNAIYGVWDVPDPLAARRQVRFELINFLLAHHDTDAARAELFALAANLPPDPSLHTQVADLFVKTGDLHSALQQYQNALQLAPRYLPALQGAGEAAYESANYTAAQQYLGRAQHLDPKNAAVAQQLATTELILRMDPLAPRLTMAERARRAVNAFNTAMQRLRSCAISIAAPSAPAPSTPSATASTSPGGSLASPTGTSSPTSALDAAFARAVTLHPVNEKTLRRHPDSLYPVMDWVASAEDAASKLCGKPTGADLALTRIAKAEGIGQ